MQWFSTEMLVIQYSIYEGKDTEQSVQRQKNLIKRQDSILPKESV